MKGGVPSKSPKLEWLLASTIKTPYQPVLTAEELTIKVSEEVEENASAQLRWAF